MMHKRILVTGTARSGTMYTSRLLSELGGLPVGHEDVFGLHTRTSDGDLLKDEEGRVITRELSPAGDPPEWGKYRVEVSWLAAPFLGRLDKDILVVHQMRHPLDTIRSIQARKFVRVGNPYTEFAYLAGAIDPYSDPLTMACHYYVRWTDIITRFRTPDLWWRVEDLFSHHWILEPLLEYAVGEDRRPIPHRERINVPKDLNGTPSQDLGDPLHLGDLSNFLADRIAAIAERFGYEI